MISGVRLGKDELKARFGVGERVAVRIGALAGRGLHLTAAVIEEAVRSRDLESLLLAPAFLERAAGLDTEALRREFPAARELTRLGDVLALDEEVQAEQTWNREASLPAAPPETLPAMAPSAALDLRDVRGALTPEAMSAIKLTLLTGVDPAAKVEALRKLALSAAPAEEKGFLAVRAVTDPAAEVRREAAVVLESMGLDRELSEALKTAASGSARQKELALRRLAALAPRAKPAERSVAAAFVIGALALETEAPVLRAAVEALIPLADLLAGHEELLGQAMRNLLKALADAPEDLHSPARRLLDAVGARNPGDRVRVLWSAAEGAGDRRLRILILEGLFGMPLPPDLEENLCRAAVGDLSGRPLEDLDSRRLADALRRRGNAALRQLLDELPRLKEESQTLLLPVLDSVATSEGIDPDLRERTGEAFLKLLKEGSRALRSILIESQLCGHSELSFDLRSRLASDFLLNLHAYKAGRIHDLTAAAIRRIGLAGADALRKGIEKSAYPIERDTAALLLGELAGEANGPAEAARAAANFLLSLEDSGRVSPGALVRATARALAGPAADPEAAELLLRRYETRLGKVSYPADLFAAIGWLASSPHVSGSSAEITVGRLVGLLEAPMPDLDVSETRSDEGTHLTVGGQTAVYTDLIPELIGAIGRILASDRPDPEERRELVGRLAVRYLAVAEFREVWAPGNVVDFGTALVRIATSEHAGADDRRVLLTALLANLRSATSVRLLAEAFSRTEETDPMYATLLGKFVDRTIAMLGRADFRERDDQRVLLDSLGRAVLNRSLGTEAELSEERRIRVVELLLEHAGIFPELRARLRELGSSPHLPPDLAARIRGTSA